MDKTANLIAALRRQKEVLDLAIKEFQWLEYAIKRRAVGDHFARPSGQRLFILPLLNSAPIKCRILPRKMQRATNDDARAPRPRSGDAETIEVVEELHPPRRTKPAHLGLTDLPRAVVDLIG